ncbi:hypothetical protein BCU39_000115 [Vibrio cyclitrophicus]|uniref:hypothetical protein n=1 Tax=Vibrio cyclitrophicus TaxID=47951 RepID=UPI000C844C26|nr:hypothetical protein [Vibrio cyclitrophicus]PMI67734.1 hypothetical protein BCU39_14865 [Vibrio cyclitrophicus]
MQNNTTNPKVSLTTTVALMLSAGVAMFLDVWEGQLGELDLSDIKTLAIGAIPALTLVIDKKLKILQLESKKTKHEVSFESGSQKLIDELVATYNNADLPQKVRDKAEAKLDAAYGLKFDYAENKVQFHKGELERATADIIKVGEESEVPQQSVTSPVKQPE